MAAEQAPHGLLGHADEAPVKELEDVSEGGTMSPVLGHDEVRRFVEHEEAVEAALLDQDAIALDCMQAAFDAAVERAALLCVRDGKLDPERLDAHQWVSYELAITSADLLAAKTLVGGDHAPGIDSGLASF